MIWQPPTAEVAGLSASHENSFAPPFRVVSPPIDGADSASPALQSAAAGLRGAYELKFLLTHEQAALVQTAARQMLSPDAHGDPSIAGSYLVNSLYTDTPEFDVYYRSPRFRRRKLRLRRYGAEPTIWLESKRKQQGLVQKRRFPLMETGLDDYFRTPQPDVNHGWFRTRLERQQLQPVCQLTYVRAAYIGQTAGETIRLTIDRQLQATLAEGWTIPTALLGGPDLLEGAHILELKFRGALPSFFRNLVQELRLQPTGFSKYRTCVDATVPWERMGRRPDEERHHA